MTFQRVERRLIAAASVLSFFAQAAAFNGVRLDDAYITYRYAQNLATGRGLVFNPGEHLLGTTSPGHALLGAVLYGVVGKGAFPALMSALGCAGWTAQAACAYVLLRDAIGRAGAAFVAVAIAVGASRAYLWVPLETNLVVALVLGAFVLASLRRWLACGIVAGVAVVFRADAAIACAVLAVIALREARLRAWVPAAGCLAVTTAWAAFAVAYFGTLVPHTVHAKVAQGSIGAYAVHALAYPALSFAPWSRLLDSGARGSWLTIVPVWALAVAGGIVLAKRSIVLAGLGAYGALLALAYVGLHPDTAFGWHLYPTSLVLAVFTLAAMVLFAARARLPRYVAAPLACAVTAGLAFEALQFEEREAVLPSYGERDNLEHQVAGYLASVAKPGDYVDAEEVGTLAYLSELPMIDHPGLVSDDAARELFAAVRGGPSRVRWAVLNPLEVRGAGGAFAGFRRAVFDEGLLELTAYDLRARAP